MRILRTFNLAGIILLLAYISFIPQTLHDRHQTFVRFFLALLFIFSVLRQKFKLRLIFGKTDIPLWIFLLGILGGVVFAENLNLAIRQYFYLCIPLVLLYYLMKSEFIQENRLPIAISLSFFSAIVVLISFIEFFYHINPIYKYQLMHNQYYDVFLGRRAMATHMHPAVLGTYLVVCLPFSFLLVKRKVFSERLLGILCLVLGLSGIILTFSRGSLMGLIALFCIWFWQKGRKRFLKYFIVSLFIFIFAFSLSKDYSSFQRFGMRGLLNKNVYGIRKLKVVTSYRMLKEHPIFGMGLAHFRINYNKYSPVPRSDEEGKVPDNMYLLFLSETGIVGLSGFLIFIWLLLKNGFRRLYLIKSIDNRNILLAIIAGLVGLLVNMNTYDVLYWTMPLFLFSILSGMIAAFVKYDE